MLLASLKGNRFLNAANREGEHQSPAIGKLLQPSGRDVPRADGQDNPVVWCASRVTKSAIRTDHLDPSEADVGQVLAGGCHQVIVDVNRDDRAMVAYDLSHQR